MFLVMGLSLLVASLYSARGVRKVIPAWRGEAVLFVLLMLVFAFGLMIEGAERMGWT